MGRLVFLEAVFLSVLNRSITAGGFILVIMFLRRLLKKMPGYVFCILWGMAALRLVCPFSFESMLSLVPREEWIPEDILYVENVSGDAQIYGIESRKVSGDETEKKLPSWMEDNNNGINPVLSSASVIWLVGTALFLFYGGFSYWKLKRQVAAAVPFGKHIYQCDQIGTPFVFGVLKPKIYIPFSLKEEYLEYVVLHEKAHMDRRDYVIKLVCFFILAVYWFCPLVWLMYYFLCQDIEFACDDSLL